MTLSEIETILKELSLRHLNLDEELLLTLLTAAGWESKTITDALVLFRNRVVVSAKKSDTSSALQPESKKEVPLLDVAPAIEKIETLVVKTESVIESAVEVIPKAVNSFEEITQEKTILSSDGGDIVKKIEAITTPADLTFYQQDGTEEGVLPVLHDVPQLSTTIVEKAKLKKEVQQVPIEQVASPVVVEEVIPIIEPVIIPEKTEIINTTNEQALRDALALYNTQQELLNKQAPPVAKEVDPVVEVVAPVARVHKEPESLIVHTEDIPLVREKKETEIPANLPLLPFESSSHVWSFSRYKDVFHGETMPEKETSKDL